MHRLRFGISGLVLVGALATTTAALAQGRQSTTAMSCQQALSTVNSAGAIVLGTGGFSYDRFVRDQSMCTREEMAVPAWAPTRDVAQCFVGFVCEMRAGREPTPN